MEPDQLQLIFNVVVITGVSSLASFCYLLKKENRKLATAADGAAKTSPSPQCAPTSSRVAISQQDIRSFASDRRTKWVEGMRERPTAPDARR